MINLEIIGDFAKITIFSGKGNLIDECGISEFSNILANCERDDRLKGLLITGDGGSFSTGLNISTISIMERADFFEKFDKFLLALFSFPKPVVAAVNGHSIGGGLLIQVCADYVVASDNEKIKLGLPELKIGLTIDDAMMNLLRFRVGNMQTLQTLLYSGDYINVHQSNQIGLIDLTVNHSELEMVALDKLSKLASYNNKSFTETKECLKRPTVENMKLVLNNKCYSIFNEL